MPNAVLQKSLQKWSNGLNGMQKHRSTKRINRRAAQMNEQIEWKKNIVIQCNVSI